MEKLPETIKLTEWKPDERVRRLPENLTGLPKIIKDVVVAVEKQYKELAGRINWLLRQLSSGNIYPLADDTYYVGKNDDDSPLAWKGIILKDTTNGKYYRIEIINGVVTATDLTD